MNTIRDWVSDTHENTMLLRRPATLNFIRNTVVFIPTGVETWRPYGKKNYKNALKSVSPTNLLREFRAFSVKRWLVFHIMVLTGGKIKCQPHNFLCGWVTTIYNICLPGNTLMVISDIKAEYQVINQNPDLFHTLMRKALSNIL